MIQLNKQSNERVKSKTEQFVKLLAKCNTQSLIAVCKILNVKLDNGAQTKEEFDLRPFEDIWAELIERFNNLGRAQRRDLVHVLKQAQKPGDD